MSRLHKMWDKERPKDIIEGGAIKIFESIKAKSPWIKVLVCLPNAQLGVGDIIK